MVSFHIEHQDLLSKARLGTLYTPHGKIETPIFMPVGTVGSVKGITQQQLQNEIKAQIILGNTYHLYLRPGMEIMKAAGGLHKFMHWDKPILTDSGGFQVFSLSANRKITREGVLFQSHIDGSKHLFSPQKVMEIQTTIGADIMMAFDECTPYPCTYEDTQKSLQLTHEWLNECIQALSSIPSPYTHISSLFPIVQGGTYLDLRKQSCEYISSKNLSGIAIGGVSVGEPTPLIYDITQHCCEHLPYHKPKYLMGVGTPWNILECIAFGIDMFDCVMPTRNGRNAMLFTTQGIINIDNQKWKNDFSPIDPLLPCEISQYYSKAYLRHLFASKELLGLQIASIHNLAFYVWIVQEARKHILAGDFVTWKQQITLQLQEKL